MFGGFNATWWAVTPTWVVDCMQKGAVAFMLQPLFHYNLDTMHIVHQGCSENALFAMTLIQLKPH